ncbi:hypothetical protein SAMN02745784_01217 [Tissierella praeacuta DSM 18095]|uniref:YolD-like protein n=1 Tax=Tissierella praeacuta DSM 18095 TaxID=1123404 RepID=A0A1M4UV97_9FIRM|nr:hypothetical protein [Tissierella praeacuta]SHE60567.1 hypothetical protein SAMN02745784_01217 [Tissierella praeacuta DSM 18095]SUP02619.1 Uncharacterised protein [Tissierella praeacuta]
MIDKYDDIINLPRHVSKRRPPMPIEDRAAQFSPFAALTGHDAAVKETARITEKRVELDQYMKEELNHKLQILIEKIKENPKIKITYFEPDEKKDGGDYVTATGTFKKMDEYEKIIFMTDDIEVSIDEIIRIEGEIFKTMVLP